jgi:predicted nicotinamide N-methyase
VIRFDKAIAREVRVGSVRAPILMAGDVDALIDDYVAAQGLGTVPADRSPFGAVLWPSGRAFVRWWDAQQCSDTLSSGSIHHTYSAPQRVFELGCGVGLVSAYFCALGAREVVATDYEPSLEPFVRANARAVCEAHGPGFSQRADALRFATLDWTKQLPDDARGAERFVVATDVLYENVHVEFLPKVAAALLHDEGVFYLADPERYRWRAARENLLAAFADVTQTTLEVESDEDDASKGVVDTGTTLTRIHILACRGPRRR